MSESDRHAEGATDGDRYVRRVSFALRDRQLGHLCDALAAVDPDAPTLCAGWDAHDLAIHVWLIKRDPLSWPGLVVPSLARPRSRRIRGRWAYAELIERLRAEPGAIACMPADRFEDGRHALGEYWIHTQDVARPNGVRQPPADDALRTALWMRVRRAAAQLHRRGRHGLVLELPDGARHRVADGSDTLIVRGEPTGLMCWVYGRETVADVTIRQSIGVPA